MVPLLSLSYKLVPRKTTQRLIRSGLADCHAGQVFLVLRDCFVFLCISFSFFIIPSYKVTTKTVSIHPTNVIKSSYDISFFCYNESTVLGRSKHFV